MPLFLTDCVITLCKDLLWLCCDDLSGSSSSGCSRGATINAGCCWECDATVDAGCWECEATVDVLTVVIAPNTSKHLCSGLVK